MYTLSVLMIHALNKNATALETLTLNSYVILIPEKPLKKNKFFYYLMNYS